MSHIHDAVYVESEQNYLINMSKSKPSDCGAFIGINKINKNAYHYFIDKIRENHEFLNRGHYETDGLVTFSKTFPIYCEKLSCISSCEIDDMVHLENAKKIYRN